MIDLNPRPVYSAASARRTDLTGTEHTFSCHRSVQPSTDRKGAYSSKRPNPYCIVPSLTSNSCSIFLAESPLTTTIT